MSANSYYNVGIPAEHEQQQHLLAHSSPQSGHSFSQPSTPLTPVHFAAQTNYHHGNGSFEKHHDLQHAEQEDARLKARIRRFRVISRVLSFLISIGVLAPISMTLHKFLQTQNIYRDVTHADGTAVSRTAWAKESKAWPTYSYFGVAAISVILNFSTIFSYKFGVSKANSAAHIASVFSWAVLIGNLVLWSVAAGVYRNEKDKHGKSNDLWGWTCSPGARAIQKEFAGEIDFNRFCNVQSASWVVGLAQVGASLLTLGIYVLVFRRRGSKREVQRLSMIGFAQ